MGEPSGSSYFCIIRRYITMMVIRGTLQANFQGITQGNPHLFPADRCVWNQGDATNREGYRIDTAYFFPGNADAVQVMNPQLGYIGKSGRFVEIAQ